jgi:hypothetical protein
MTPIVPGFNLETTIIAKDQPDGTVTTRERLQVLFGGSIWLQVLTFNMRHEEV